MQCLYKGARARASGSLDESRLVMRETVSYAKRRISELALLYIPASREIHAHTRRQPGDLPICGSQPESGYKSE